MTPLAEKVFEVFRERGKRTSLRVLKEKTGAESHAAVSRAMDELYGLSLIDQRGAALEALTVYGEQAPIARETAERLVKAGMLYQNESDPGLLHLHSEIEWADFYVAAGIQDKA